jgi:hypothetical protein
MWTKVRREKSKQLAPEPLGVKPNAKSGPAQPKDPSKPPYPYTMTPSEAQEYRWRWVEANLSVDEDDETFEAAAYCIEVLRSMGATDIPAYISKVEQYMDQQERRARRDYRMKIFKTN